MSWTLPGLLRASGGELVQWGPGPFRAFSTDSRRVGQGDMFLALNGPHHDGHDFVLPALGRGASGALVSRAGDPSSDDVAWIRVDDTLRAYGDLAAAWRRSLRTRIVAVTGSNGKTTTKEMIAAIIAASGAAVAKSLGNENNLVGVPQTLLRLTGEEEYAVVEMGMNHAGEIWRLAEIARPDVGVITNVGPAHLENLGSLGAIAAAKGELALALSPNALLIVNGADVRLTPIADAFPGRTQRAGTSGPARVIAVGVPDEGAQRIELELAGSSRTVRLRGVGSHNVTNALLAATTGLALGFAPDVIVAGLESFVPPPMRLEVSKHRSGAWIWNDAYNANPASMEAALATLAAEPTERRVAVLGEMWELGPEASRYHHDLGRSAAERGIDLLVVVGRYAGEMASGARASGLPESRIVCCDTARQAVDRLRGELSSGVVVLVKGSRGARMEDVVHGLEEDE